MKTKTLQGLSPYVLTALTTVMMVFLLTSCALDLNNVLGIKKVVVKPVVPPSAVRITYNGNGNDSGSAPVDENEYKSGEMAVVMPNNGGLTLTGHTFAGWNTSADGSGTGYEAASQTPESFAIKDKDVTLYAMWSRDVYIKTGETYTGAIKGHAVHMEAGGIWEMEGDSTLMYLDAADLSLNRNKIIADSIRSNGYNIYFDENQDQNKMFDLGTFVLPGGGRLMPKFPTDVEASINAIHYVDAINKQFLNEEITIEDGKANRSAVYVKNGGVATLKHAAITTASSSSAMRLSSVAGTRWGLNAALYSCFAGTLTAEDVKVTARGGASAGVYASFLGYVRLADSSIQCENLPGNFHGVEAAYGGRVDLENVYIETWPENGSVLTTGAGGGSISAKNITGVAHGKNSPGLYADGYGDIVVEGSNFRSENGSVVIISTKGSTTVTDSTLISNTTAIKANPFGQPCWDSGSGTFINTKIISGGDAFYYNGMSADIVIQDGTTVEFPDGCKLIRAESQKGAAIGSSEKPDPVKGTFTAKNVTLRGDIELAEDGTTLMVSLKDGSQYKGAVNGASIAIDETSMWTVTETCIIAGIDALSASRINCPSGFRVYYDAGINHIGKIRLNGGGELVPIQDS